MEMNVNPARKKQQELKTAMLHQLSPGKYQPRREFGQKSLQELSDSIASQGILQQVPIITCNVSDKSALAFGLIENIQRQDLNHIEEAFALRRLIEECNMTHEKVEKSAGRCLLNLAKPVQDFLIKKTGCW